MEGRTGRRVLLAVIVGILAFLPFVGGKTFAELFCEKNDCDGNKASAISRGEREVLERAIDRLQRRYLSTGEVAAIVSKSVHFLYEQKVVDDEEFPGLKTGAADKAERLNDRAAAKARRRRARRRKTPDAEAGGEDPRAAVARRWFQRHVAADVRMGCKYDIIRPGRVGNFTRLPHGSPWGCAAGSVWVADASGMLVIDETKLFHKTEEYQSSVWCLVNGSDTEWFEHPKHHTVWVDPDSGRLEQGPVGKRTLEARRLSPMKRFAPPPCAPGYGGASCRREIGAGGDYADDLDEIPLWMNRENADRIIHFWRTVRDRHAQIVSFSRPSAAAVNRTLQGYAESAGGGGGLEAEGAWYGGWWIQVGWEGIQAESPGDVEEITVGEARCKHEVWISPSSALCMVPRGMGRSIQVSVSLKGWGKGTIEGAGVTYLPPQVDRLIPEHAPARGGSLVTLQGTRFGLEDSNPRVIVGGRLCMETFWQGDNEILCRVPPGWGSVIGVHGTKLSDVAVQGTKHSAEVRFEDSAPHNLKLPSKARGLVLSAKAVLLGYSRSMVEACDAPNDYGRALEETVAVEARRRRAVATARLVEVAEDEQRREEKERDIKAKAMEGAKRRKEALEAAAGSRANEAIDPAVEERERRAEEERAKAAAKKAKFDQAKRRGRQSKARSMAMAALAGSGDMASALKELRDAGVPPEDDAVVQLRTSLGLPLVEAAAETEKVAAKQSIKGMRGDGGNADHTQEGARVDAGTITGVGAEQREKKGDDGGQGTVGGEGEDDDLPDLEVYEESESAPSRGKKGRRKVKKGKQRGKGAPKGEESVLL